MMKYIMVGICIPISFFTSIFARIRTYVYRNFIPYNILGTYYYTDMRFSYTLHCTLQNIAALVPITFRLYTGRIYTKPNDTFV